MVAFRRPAFLALAAVLGAVPARADAPRGGLHRPAARGLTVRPRRDGLARPAAATLGVAVAPGLVFATPFALVAGHPATAVRVPHYLGPDGTYESQADLVRSIGGTPCGQACTRRALERWGYAPVE